MKPLPVAALLVGSVLVLSAATNTQLTARVTDLEARVTALEAIAWTTPPPSVTPSPAPSSTVSPTSAPPSTTPTSTPTSPWTQVFYDGFTTWDPSRYFVYPSTWTNSNGTGRYGAPVTSDGNHLRINLHTDATGTPRVAGIVPIPEGSLSARGDLPNMRVEFRIRADRMVGYKGVPLLWPMSGNWPTDGEINWPESHFDAQPRAFMHRQDGTSGSDQDYYSSPAGTTWQDWHTYVIEWRAGVSCEFFIDGTSIGKSTSRVPETPMHLVAQFETQLTQVKPDPSVSGYVEVDYLTVWVPS